MNLIAPLLSPERPLEDSPSSAIANLLLLQDILLNVEISSKDRLFDQIGRHMEQVHGLSQTGVAASLARRERLGSTGLGEGFAIPHARAQDLDRIQLAYLRLKTPIPFDTPDGKPVYEILALLVPKEAAEEHLRILADAIRMFSAPRFREQLQRCADPLEVKRMFDAWSLPS